MVKLPWHSRQGCARQRQGMSDLAKDFEQRILSAMRKRFWFLMCLLTLVSANANEAAGSNDPIAHLVEEATQWVALQQDLDTAWVDVRRPDQRAQITHCDTPLQFSLPFINNPRTVKAECEKPRWQLFLSVSIRDTQNGVVASRDLKAGETLTEDDLLAQRIPATSKDAIQLLSVAVDQTLAVDVEKNTPLTMDQLTINQWVWLTDDTYNPGDPIQVADLLRVQKADAEASVKQNWSTEFSIATKRLEAGKVIKQGDVEPAIAVVTAKEMIPHRQIVTSDLIELRVVPQTSQSRSALTELAEAAGFEVTRSIAAGTPLTRADLRPAELIRSGETVKLVINRGALRITIDTTALSDGRLGEQVRLRNNESGREIQATVTGRHRAEGR